MQIATTDEATTAVQHGRQAIARRQVIRRERQWHEHQAHERYALDSFLYAAPAFQAVVAAGLAYLQAEPGTYVLEVACGEGKELVTLVQRGATVVGVDLSLAQLRRARARLAAEGVTGGAYFVQCNAEELPFEPGSVDALYGKAILHHLDLRTAADEIGRLLAPGQRASFAEPLAHHPLLWLGRRLTPRLRTRDERPMRLDELTQFARRFDEWELHTFFLLAPLAYGLRLLPGGEPLFRRAHRALQRLDAWLMRRWPGLRRWAWYGLVNVRRAPLD